MTETPNNSKPTVTVSADRMSAVLTLPPRTSESAYSYDQCYKLLQNHKIDITGEVDYALKALLKRQANEPTIEHSAEIAKGKPVIDGQDGRLEFREGFNPDEISPVEASPEEKANGAVDFYTRQVFVVVKAGDMIGKLIPPVDGVPGKTVCHEEIAPRPARPCPHSIDEDSILIRDNGTLVAREAGVLSSAGGELSVRPDLEIPGYVDFSTGHVKFTGDIIIAKGVRDCFEVTAGGSITVNKMVEAATLKADQDIILNGGMAAREKGYLQVGRNLVARYLDNVEATVEGDVTIAKEIINCRLNVGGSLTGERAVLAGGDVSVGGRIELAEIGADAGVTTEVMIGGSPEIEQMRPKINEVLAKVNDRKEQLRVEYSPLHKNADRLSADQQRRYRDLRRAMRRLDDLTKKVRLAEADLQAVADKYVPIDVMVHKMIHPGTRLVLGDLLAVFNTPLAGPLRIHRGNDGEFEIEDLQRRARAPLANFATVTKLRQAPPELDESDEFPESSAA